MTTWYNIAIQTLRGCELTDEMIKRIGQAIWYSETNIDERELYRLTAVFSCEEPHEAVEQKIKAVLEENPGIFYIDMLYRDSNDYSPTRVTFWQNGKVQTYKTHIFFEEEE